MDTWRFIMFLSVNRYLKRSMIESQKETALKDKTTLFGFNSKKST